MSQNESKYDTDQQLLWSNLQTHNVKPRRGYLSDVFVSHDLVQNRRIYS